MLSPSCSFALFSFGFDPCFVGDEDEGLSLFKEDVVGSKDRIGSSCLSLQLIPRMPTVEIVSLVRSPSVLLFVC